MQIRNCLEEYIDSRLLVNDEVKRAFEEFLKNIPTRILNVDVDTSKTGKQGYLDGEKVYKFGCIIENKVRFLEYFENRAQGEPTMSLFLDMTNGKIIVKGWKVDKKFYLAYFIKDGNVEKVAKLD